MNKPFILLILLFSLSTYSQEKVIEEVEFVETSEQDQDENTNEISFAVIENVPVYKGCGASTTNTELKNCMSAAISKHIADNFNTNITNGLGLPDGRVRINVIFKIDKEGNVVDIRSKAPHPVLEKEAIRVIQLIPQLEKPGYQRGNPVTVPYSLPIIFNVQNPKKSSKSTK
ncbi:energy transducer TonB [Mariniflexile litorale]|uniref:Energy transducer TonB n=1 Tax=Mariniflexile litorale TaxID=3045158 RepID=A0AAU7EK89_9FLAO|nr:energy transducer TonB [Mariniflexile sp. KMM 9835]MDQ8210336.1 energy transducer TonB [Mariniflexile sp. KMM 9835]